jgi:hypothetical protein
MVDRMPILSPTFMVSIAIKGDSCMTFNLMVVSLLDHLESHFLKLDHKRFLLLRAPCQ